MEKIPPPNFLIFSLSSSLHTPPLNASAVDSGGTDCRQRRGGWGEAARETMSAIRGRGADGGVSPAGKRKLGGRGVVTASYWLKLGQVGFELEWGP